jgi:DNA-binding CsgD family transcriptional regulator
VIVLEQCINFNTYRCSYRLALKSYYSGGMSLSNGFCPTCNAHTMFYCPACGRLNVTKYQLPELHCCECRAIVDKVASRRRKQEQTEHANYLAAQTALIRAAGLSSREVQVLCLTASGYCNKEISGALRIALRTVEGYKNKIMLKTGLHSTVHLTHLAIENQLVPVLRLSESVLSDRRAQK